MSFAKVKNEPNDAGREQQASSRGGPVVHVRGDSETELDLLFSVLKNDSKQPGQTFRDKNLPFSFFNPPEPKPGGSHSREGSLDYTGGSSGTQAHQQLQANAGGSNVFHARSHSSPAKLPVSLSLPNPGQHAKQGSGDLIGDNQVPKYCFVSNPSNAWQSEQCKPHEVNVSMVSGGQSNKQVNGGTTQGGIAQQQAGDGNAANIGPLPPGWEQGVTAEGDIYYINHNNKTTSWYDPRLPRHMQKPGAQKVNPGQPQQPGAQHGPLSQLSQSNPMAKQQVQPAVAQQASHMAKQQQQFLQQQQQQQQQNQLLMKQLPTNAQIRASPGMLSPMNQQQSQQQQQQQQPMRVMCVADQIRLELQKLQKERERLAHEQEENNRKEQMLIKELMTQQMLQSGGGQGDSLSGLVAASNLMVPQQQQAMQQQMNMSGVDPFLGQTVLGGGGAGGGPDMHARQNSGDSGLGNCYSLPRTPEDFLGNVDALDRHDLNSLQKKQHLAQQKQQLCDFGMNQRPGSLGALDMASLNDPSSVEPMSMDSDELVSTLTDDLELGRDFLDMQMMDMLL